MFIRNIPNSNTWSENIPGIASTCIIRVMCDQARVSSRSRATKHVYPGHMRWPSTPPQRCWHACTQHRTRLQEKTRFIRRGRMLAQPGWHKLSSGSRKMLSIFTVSEVAEHSPRRYIGKYYNCILCSKLITLTIYFNACSNSHTFIF